MRGALTYFMVQKGGRATIRNRQTGQNVGTLYVLGGDFVHYNNGAQRNWKLAIYVPKIKRYLEVEYKHLTSQSQSCINTESNSWMMNLPVFENVELW